MLRVLIADDHEIVRRGIKQILQEEYSFAHFDEAADTSTLIDKAISGGWDIIVSDLAMPGGGGLHALQQISQHAPGIPVLILSIYPEEQYAARVMKAGAVGYLNKDAAPDELVNAVQNILSGRKYVTESVAQQLSITTRRSAGRAMHELLSEREFMVFSLIIRGSSVAEIAEKLSLSATTVSTYRSRILTKMNVQNNAGLIQYAVQNGLI